MEDLIGVIIVLAIIGVVIWFFITVVLPILLTAGSFALLVTVVIAAIIGLICALINYGFAIRQEINFKQWDWLKSDEPAKRSYFFGPGYIQLGNTIKKSFELNWQSGKDLREKALGFYKHDGWLGWIEFTLYFVFMMISFLCIFTVGTGLCLLLGIVHGTITTACLLIIYLIFSMVWLTDRAYLMKNKIRSDCPICHTTYTIPAFKCSNCGKIHYHLTPGPYGIWHHTCECGTKLPATFFNGRSSLEATCPHCASGISASDVRPIVFQLVGATKSGKTVFLSSFFHEYIQRLRTNKNLEIEIKDEYQPLFEKMEEWYSGNECPSTSQLNSQMYPVIIDSPLGIKRQFSIYDIAGEMFDGITANTELEQKQFHYCNGILFIFDPFSSSKLKIERINNGESVENFSNVLPENVVSNFLNYFTKIGQIKAGTLSDIPVAIMVAKSDIKEVRREIGPIKIKAEFKNNEDKYVSLQNARDDIIRNFLVKNGFSAALEDLETQFSNVHYFSLSAMGHESDGTCFEPWGVTEAVDWLLPQADQEFSELITTQSA